MAHYVTADELAESLRLSSEMILQMARDGRIPAIRLSSKAIRFDVQAVAEALNKLSAKPEARHE